MIRHRDTACMEEEGCYSCCCSGGEAGLHRQDMLIELLRQKDTRHQRMAQLLAVTLLLLLSGALALLVSVVIGGRSQQSVDSQPMMQPYLPDSSGVSVEQQQQKDFKNPSAMLTAPKGNNVIGKYLEWESKEGNAFCHGGFNYASGNLSVPRSGIYRVFLQITYESTDKLKCNDELRLTNSVYFIWDAYNTDVPLLSSVDTVSCSMEQWSKTLYTAGLFSLEANGRLRANSSHPDLIVKSEYKVFFGAELLPQ